MSTTTANTTTLAHATIGPVLSTTDVKRAHAFYTQKLGLTVMSQDDHAIRLGCGDGTSLFIYQRDEAPGATNTAAAFEVKNLEETVAGLRANGVVFEEYDVPGLKTTNGIATTGDWSTAWFKDPDGNIIAVGTTR